MTDVHPAAKPEHVRQVLDNLKALERRMIMADMSRDEPNDDAHLVGKAIIVIESLGSELDKRLRPRAIVRKPKASQATDLMAALEASLPTAGRAVAGPVTYDEDPDYIKDGIKDGWLDEAGNVNEPPDVEP